MLLITALLFFSLLNISAQTSHAEAFTELMKGPIEELHENIIGDLEWDDGLAEEARKELEAPLPKPKGADLKLTGTTTVTDGNQEESLLQLVKGFLEENKGRGIKSGSHYGCGSFVQRNGRRPHYQSGSGRLSLQLDVSCLNFPINFSSN
ncbi:hypothetical protein OSTOST_22386 [Ostertagia ostertagi]